MIPDITTGIKDYHRNSRVSGEVVDVGVGRVDGWGRWYLHDEVGAEGADACDADAGFGGAVGCA